MGRLNILTLRDMVFQQARGLAQRVLREAGDLPEHWVGRAWKIALGRAPSHQERAEALQLLDSLAQNYGQSQKESESPIDSDRLEPLTRFCLALMNLNEFLYID